MYRSEDGPRPDPAVLRQLRRVDPSVYPVWRNTWMDASTGARLICDNGEPVWAPMWWIFKHCHDGKDRLLFRTPHFDNRVWRRIESDAARHLRSDQVDALILQDEKDRIAKGEKLISDQDAGIYSSNTRKFESVLTGDNINITDDRSMYREKKPRSYAKQPSRNTAGTKVRISNREAGWEMPWGETE